MTFLLNNKESCCTANENRNRIRRGMQTSDPKGPKWPILMYLDNVNKEPLFIFEIGSDMILYGF